MQCSVPGVPLVVPAVHVICFLRQQRHRRLSVPVQRCEVQCNQSALQRRAHQYGRWRFAQPGHSRSTAYHWRPRQRTRLGDRTQCCPCCARRLHPQPSAPSPSPCAHCPRPGAARSTCSANAPRRESAKPSRALPQPHSSNGALTNSTASAPQYPSSSLASTSASAATSAFVVSACPSFAAQCSAVHLHRKHTPVPARTLLSHAWRPGTVGIDALANHPMPAPSVYMPPSPTAPRCNAVTVPELFLAVHVRARFRQRLHGGRVAISRRLV